MKPLILLTTILSISAVADGYEGQYSSNPYATPKAQIQPGRTYQLRESKGTYRGQIGGSEYHPDSINNEYGRYGSQYSPDSIRNEYGAGSRYRSESPSNEYGRGLEVWGE